jgi:hypothetical protein
LRLSATRSFSSRSAGCRFGVAVGFFPAAARDWAFALAFFLASGSRMSIASPDAEVLFGDFRFILHLPQSAQQT